VTVNWGHRAVRWFLAVVVVAVALWAGTCYYQSHHDKTQDFKRDSKAARESTVVAHTATVKAGTEVARVDTVWLPGRIRWRAARDRALADTANHEAVAIARIADSVITGDSLRILARDTLIAAQKREIRAVSHELDVWKRKPGPPRLQAYAEGLYDLIHSAPVARVGVDFHVIGPLSVAGAGEYAVPLQGQTNSSFRVTAGVRFNFQ
jgi:hypothetical protein